MVKNMNKSENTSETVDRFGAFASTACAIHCAISGLIPATLGALGLGFLIGHQTEWFLAGVAIIFGLAALFASIKSHRNIIIISVLCFGIGGLLTAKLLEGEGHHDDLATSLRLHEGARHVR